MKLHRRSASRYLPLLLASIAAVRLATLGLYPLMDSTEARYAEIARKMAEIGDWVTPWFEYGLPFWGKPPLSFWMTAASFRLFGIGELASRLPHWSAGLLLAWLVWDWARRSRGPREALIALALLAGSALYLLAAGAVMTDMALALSVGVAMRGFWLGLHGASHVRARERWLFFAGIAAGLLAKGPVALVLIAGPIAGWVLLTGSSAPVWRGLPWVRGSVLALAIALPWYLAAESRTPGFLNYFFLGEHWSRFTVPGWNGDLYGNAHRFPRGTIWLFAAIAAMPWTLLLPLAALRWRRGARAGEACDPAPASWRLYVALWGLAPCLFFTFAGNILWTYVLPGLPGLALWTAARLSRCPDAASVDRLLAGGVLLTLLGMSVLTASVHIGERADLRSARGLVAEYRLRREPGEALIYLGKRSYSAAFYSGGTAEAVADTAQLVRRLHQGRAFVAIETGALEGLPKALLAALQPVSRHGRFELFHARH